MHKEFQLDMRKKQVLFGILLFVLSSVYVCYLSLERIDSAKTLSALFWLVGLFGAFHAMTKSFSQEEQGSHFLLYTLASPRSIWLAKGIYYSLLLVFLNLLSSALFTLFFGAEIWEKAGGWLFAFIVFGSFGLGTALTFLSAMAFKANGSSGLITVLGFPILMPFMQSLSMGTQEVLNGGDWGSVGLYLIILLGLTLLSAVLALFLVPFFWKG